MTSHSLPMSFRRGALLAAVVCLALPRPATAAKISRHTFESGGDERVYYLALPKDFDAAAPVPLVILLHGSKRDGRSLVEKWDGLARKEGFIAVGPDSAVSDWWEPGTDGPDFLRDLVDHLAAQYPVDPLRVYLFGHSAGAGFALQMGLLESRYFAAAALHAGALSPGTEEWLPAKAERKIPYHMAVGTRDAYVPLERARATRDALAAAGIPVELVEMPNHDHWYYDLAPRINRAAWEFLSAHALEEEPVFEKHRFQ